MHRRMTVGTVLLTLVIGAIPGMAAGQGSARTGITFCCAENNDLYKLFAADGERWLRFDTPETAIEETPEGYGLLILADKYPEEQVEVGERLLEHAKKKRLRLYIEYPKESIGVYMRDPREVRWERVVVASTWFGNPAQFRLLTAHNCHYVPMNVTGYLMLAQVAGYDRTVYPLPEWTGIRTDDARLFCILAKHPLADVLLASTKLSHFATGRYAPAEAWRLVWQKILQWVSGKPIEMREWVKTVDTSYTADESLPADAHEQVWRRAAQWYLDSRMLIHPEWIQKVQDAKSEKDQIAPAMDEDYLSGDGTLGILEGFSSSIHHSGRQPARFWIRADCVSESAMVLALAGMAQGDSKLQQIAGNLQDFLYGNSKLAKGAESDAHGLLGWNTDSGQGTFYGDDNARALLATLAAAAALNTDRWNEPMLRALLGNLRTTGKLGFRGNALTEDELRQHGWRHYFNAETSNIAPHYESYLWACYLWAYRQTGFPAFLERAKSGISATMDAYPKEWKWTIGMQEDRARMLLPLAWLVRVEDNERHRQWLRQMAADLLKSQDPSGAIPEELGEPGKGQCPPPASNEAYGTQEMPVIQENGDPACDLLYTLGFAFIGLHEAAAATQDAFYTEAENKLAGFLTRIQISSRVRRELNGAWFRGFDYKKWEYWGSNGDAGWGVWSVETGWGQSWIASTFVLRHVKQSLWGFTSDLAVKKHLAALEPVFFPSP